MRELKERRVNPPHTPHDKRAQHPDPCDPPQYAPGISFPFLPHPAPSAVHSSGFMVQSSRFTVHGSQSNVRCPMADVAKSEEGVPSEAGAIWLALRALGSRFMIHSPRFTVQCPMLNTQHLKPKTQNL